MTEPKSMCPCCGKLFAHCRLIPSHDYPEHTRQVCPGVGQTPRNPETDQRTLWKDLKSSDR